MDNNQEIKWESLSDEQTLPNNDWGSTNSNIEGAQENPPFLNNSEFFPVEEIDLNSKELQTNDIPISNNENKVINISNSFSYLGEVNKIQISNHLYYFDIDNSQAIQDLNNINLSKLDNDCKFDFNPKPDTALGKIIENIVKIMKKQNLKIKDCFLYKTPPNHSILNLFRNKSKNYFIYFIQSNNKGGNIILDLSSIGGPVVPIETTNKNLLNIIPGWIPCSISKNTSNNELIFIAGTLD